MSDYEETPLASVVIENDRQLALLSWVLTVDPERGGNATRERGWDVTLCDSDGNAVATLGRVEAGTSIAAVYESSAWKMFLAMIPRVDISMARNGIFFDLGSGPERAKA